VLTIATALFAIAVIAGIWMAVIHMDSEGRRLPPFWLAIGHGIFAVVAFVVLVWAIGHASSRGLSTGSHAFGVIAAWLFIAAALVGVYLFLRHLRRRRLPGVVIAAHMLLAVTGFVVLVVYWSFP
jgi:hypothetical protein